MKDFELRLDPAAVEALGFGADAYDLAEDVGDQVAEAAARLAPKETGEGARSIHAEVETDGESVYADVSWAPDAFYMGFHELGTEHQSARPFLRPALDQTQI